MPYTSGASSRESMTVLTMRTRLVRTVLIARAWLAVTGDLPFLRKSKSEPHIRGSLSTAPLQSKRDREARLSAYFPAAVKAGKKRPWQNGRKYPSLVRGLVLPGPIRFRRFILPDKQ